MCRFLRVVSTAPADPQPSSSTTLGAGLAGAAFMVDSPMLASVASQSDTWGAATIMLPYIVGPGMAAALVRDWRLAPPSMPQQPLPTTPTAPTRDAATIPIRPATSVASNLVCLV